jgi:hypothetical protein
MAGAPGTRSGTTNYQFYRDTVITNRLPAQSVNVLHEGDDPHQALARQKKKPISPSRTTRTTRLRELLMNAHSDKVAEENKYELLNVVALNAVG